MIDTLFVGIRWLLQRLGHTITAVFEPDAVGITKRCCQTNAN